MKAIKGHIRIINIHTNFRIHREIMFTLILFTCSSRSVLLLLSQDEPGEGHAVGVHRFPRHLAVLVSALPQCRPTVECISYVGRQIVYVAACKPVLFLCLPAPAGLGWICLPSFRKSRLQLSVELDWTRLDFFNSNTTSPLTQGRCGILYVRSLQKQKTL